LVAKRFVRWSSLGLALMFALFVLLMELPSAIASPSTRMFWILATREGTFAIGGLALFASAIAADRPDLASTVATMARVWTEAVLVGFGIQNVLFSQYSPGVPSTTPVWVPAPAAIAYVTRARLGP
jgi:peptidoglycan/LPS O-acetylase OafA/YrhL